MKRDESNEAAGFGEAAGPGESIGPGEAAWDESEGRGSCLTSALHQRFETLCGWALNPGISGGEENLPKGSWVPDHVLSCLRELRRSGHDRLVISACLLGIACRYDGKSKPVAGIEALLERLDFEVVPICPEMLAELGVPRPPMSFRKGDGRAMLDGAAALVDRNGRSCTEAMTNGAGRAETMAREVDARWALLKERSPSCGLHQVDVSGSLVEGRGVFAALAMDHGWRCYSEEELERLIRDREVE
ncbi:MAG: DUF523 domain-containing protein [Deltaproteobacteria bacterium]|nr:DUF523 domain-containing protein [Deltaproteobacteria bacterium]